MRRQYNRPYRRPTPTGYSRPRPRRRGRLRIGRLIIVLLIFAAIIAGIVFGIMFLTKSGVFAESSPQIPAITPSAQPGASASLPADDLVAAATAATAPAALGLQTELQQNGETLASFNRTYPISFPSGGAYTSLAGLTAFRGNNYRDTAHLGTVEKSVARLDEGWSFDMGAALTENTAAGQPVIIQWDADLRRMMNLYDGKKSKDNLTEVIFPATDGKLYFLDLSDGSATRDPIDMGFSVNGSAAADPRGYPLLYVGQGGNGSGPAYMNIYSLIDGQLLYRCGAEQQDAFAYRSSYQRFDASPLIASDADTLVWPGENGILYTIRLNSDFDRAAGTVSVSPDEPVKYRYTASQYADDTQISGQTSRLYGFQSSPAAWKNYLFAADNGGLMQCIDLNTMTPVYAQDLGGSTDAALLFERTEEGAFLYSGSYSADSSAHIRKLNAVSGEVIWQKDLGGSVWASPVLGTGILDGMVFFSVSGTSGGQLIAFNKSTGDIAWQYSLEYAGTSSPAALYTADGNGYILQCDGGGKLVVLDGKTGQEAANISLGGKTQGSPAIFGDIAVMQSGQKLFGINIG